MEQRKKFSVGVISVAFLLWFLLCPTYEAPLTLAAIVIHEAGHTVAARAFKVPSGGFRLTFFEARIALSGCLLSYGKEWCISAAGPVCNLICFVISISLGGTITGEDPLSFFAAVSLALAVLNLIPIKGFDGGRMLRCIIIYAGPRIADAVCGAVSFFSLFCLWCASVYALIREGTNLSLFLFSATIFSRLFSTDQG